VRDLGILGSFPPVSDSDDDESRLLPQLGLKPMRLRYEYSLQTSFSDFPAEYATDLEIVMKFMKSGYRVT
jgi:hypothetical protein